MFSGDRMSRLSGECSRRAFYTRRPSIRGERPDVGGGMGFPRHQRPERPGSRTGHHRPSDTRAAPHAPQTVPQTMPEPVGVTGRGKRMLGWLGLLGGAAAMAPVIYRAAVGTGAWSHPRYTVVQNCNRTELQWTTQNVGACGNIVSPAVNNWPPPGSVNNTSITSFGLPLNLGNRARAKTYSRTISGTDGAWSQDVDKYWSPQAQYNRFGEAAKPHLNPMIDPMQLPVHSPQPRPVPVPHHVIPELTPSPARVDQPVRWNGPRNEWKAPRQTPRPRPSQRRNDPRAAAKTRLPEFHSAR